MSDSTQATPDLQRRADRALLALADAVDILDPEQLPNSVRGIIINGLLAIQEAVEHLTGANDGVP